MNHDSDTEEEPDPSTMSLPDRKTRIAIPDAYKSRIELYLKHHNQNLVVSRYAGAFVLVKDFIRLDAPGWMNDIIINHYCCLLADRNIRHRRAAAERLIDPIPLCLFMPSFFWSQYVSSGYDGVKRWTKPEKVKPLIDANS